MVEKVIRCTRCNKVIPRFGPFGDFGETSRLPGVEWSSEELDVQKEFLKDHQGHLFEELSIDPETWISDKPSYEPVKVVYVEASNGEKRFLLKRTRAAFDRPASYELIPGKIQVTDVSLEIQENELQHQISCQDGSFPLSAKKVEEFIRAFREEIKSIPPDRLNEEIETTLPGETPLLKHGSLSEARWEKILERCRKKDFQQHELTLLGNFIRENRQPDDVLGLVIKKMVSIS